jgi:hypothetical protein
MAPVPQKNKYMLPRMLIQGLPPASRISNVSNKRVENGSDPPQSAVATDLLNLVSQVGTKGLLQASCFVAGLLTTARNGSHVILVGSKNYCPSRTAQGTITCQTTRSMAFKSRSVFSSNSLAVRSLIRLHWKSSSVIFNSVKITRSIVETTFALCWISPTFLSIKSASSSTYFLFP